MRNCAKPLLGNQFTGFAADAVSSVFNSEEGVAQIGYKLELTLTQLGRLLPIEHSGGFLEGIEGPRGIGSVISIAGMEARRESYSLCALASFSRISSLNS